LNEKKIEKIVLTRPAVEAGESLGFLPGDLQQKVDPYLRPLFDSLHSIFGFDRTNSLIDKGIIEVAPLAFMRGRTLDNSLIILDEAQNTTCSQMRMFLTRLGERSKMVVNGDITQIDLKKDQESGLIEASRIFSETEGIKFCYLNIEDVVRHPLVQKIIEAYQ
jgi:phosphate starvation-inducible PhoH-like protein